MSSVKIVTISLIICTRNNGPKLKRCLESIDSVEMSEVGGELVLVDNGSTDNTYDIFAAYEKSCKFPVKIIKEPRIGLSNARNTGVLQSEGKVIAFTDDDCYLTPGFLRGAIKVFKQKNFSYCGGRILLYDQTDASFAITRQEHMEIIPPYSFILPGKIQGANMLIERELINKIGLFDTMFGAGTPFRCEDIDYCAKASMNGFVGAFVPELVIYHHHERKQGHEVEMCRKANDYARGAYYAKYIIMRKWIFLKKWMEIIRFRKDKQILFREISGAIHYIGVRIYSAAYKNK